MATEFYSDDRPPGYEVTVSCPASSWHFNKTEYAQFPETIDAHITMLVAQHKATGCTEEPRVFDALAEGIAAQERRMDRFYSL